MEMISASYSELKLAYRSLGISASTVICKQLTDEQISAVNEYILRQRELNG